MKTIYIANLMILILIVLFALIPFYLKNEKKKLLAERIFFEEIKEKLTSNDSSTIFNDYCDTLEIFFNSKNKDYIINQLEIHKKILG